MTQLCRLLFRSWAPLLVVELWMPSTDRTSVMTDRLGGPDYYQTGVRGLQSGQAVLPEKNENV